MGLHPRIILNSALPLLPSLGSSEKYHVCLLTLAQAQMLNLFRGNLP